MMLLLRRSGAQAAALDRALGEMRDPASPHYREWLTPASYGAKYGISDADLSVVTGWLKGQGFTIERVPEARNVIVFSGTVGTVEKAFHTSIHRYLVAGVEHYANASDPQIPAALAPVVAGISPMNDFRARPQHEVGARRAGGSSRS
jgi:subtilase family serine protease